MPEGDTIHRTASTLSRAIGGKLITGCRSSLPGLAEARITGLRITSVESRGKYLLVRLEGGRTILSHMRMNGSWHIYRPGERWWKPERNARLVLETTDFVAVCFSAPLVELLDDREVERRTGPLGLGPDLLGLSFDGMEARRRLRERGELTMGEALLVQQALAGIGNVYKSEALFVSRLWPFARVRDLSDAELDRVIALARRLLGANLGGHPRDTRGGRAGGRHWVYGRSGKPCFCCGTRIRMRRQGAAGRSTYWCPQCQKDVVRPGQIQPGAVDGT